jgi:hypothetical protein
MARKLEATKALVDYSRGLNDKKMLGHLNTTWGAVPLAELASFEPLRHAVSYFK